MHTGARSPAVPSFSCAVMHLLRILCTPVACLIPTLLSVLTHFTRSAWPFSTPGVPLISPRRMSALALCCDSMQLAIAPSSVSALYDVARPACTLSVAHALAIFAAPLLAAAAILSADLVSGHTPGICAAMHFPSA